MKIVERENQLHVTAPAKVNLHLEVLGKRPDGYHEIETLMVTISLADELVFEPTADNETVLLCQEAAAGPAENNLVTRAVRLMRAESGRTDGVRIKLEKRIPVAAGLAGGSTDAAATLMGLNRLWGLGWSTERLANLAARLGSDIPFFFAAPAAIARGRGEQVTPIVPGASLDLVLVAPDDGLSTAAVYGALQVPTQPVSIEPLVSAFRTGDVAAVGQRLFNRLQEASVTLSPAVAALVAASRQWNCHGSLMSGSGSSYFAVCPSPTQAEVLATRLRADQGRERGGIPKGRIFVVQTTLEDA